MLEIGKRKVGPGQAVYIIAELSANHQGKISEALKLVAAAKEAGADAIKLQTYTPDTMTIDSKKKYFMVGGGTPWDGQSLYELYSTAYTPWEWHAEIQGAAHKLGLDFFSTPFDETAVDFLQKLNVELYKVASFEMVDIPLIEKIASTNKPIIMSTGMGSMAEVRQAVDTVRRVSSSALALLKCTSAYPAPMNAIHLRSMNHLGREFDLPVGLSDHTLGIEVPVAAVALGACIIEKHFTISRDVPGPDISFSLEPAEFSAMVKAVRNIEQALGDEHYQAKASEDKMRKFRRSLFVVKDIKAGELLTKENVRSIRPGDGMPPSELSKVIGRKAKTAIERGTPLSRDLFD